MALSKNYERNQKIIQLANEGLKRKQISEVLALEGIYISENGVTQVVQQHLENIKSAELVTLSAQTENFRDKQMVSRNQAEALKLTLDNVGIQKTKSKDELIEEIVSLYKETNTFEDVGLVEELQLVDGTVELGFHSINFSKLLQKEKEVVCEKFTTLFEKLIEVQVNHIKSKNLTIYLGNNIFEGTKLREGNTNKAEVVTKDIKMLANTFNKSLQLLKQVFKNIDIIVVYNDLVDTKKTLNDYAFDYNLLFSKFLQNVNVILVENKTGEVLKKGEEIEELNVSNVVKNNYVVTKGNINFQKSLHILHKFNVKEVVSFNGKETESYSYTFKQKTFSSSISKKLVYNGKETYFLG